MKLTLQEKYNNAQLYWTLYASVKKKKKKKGDWKMCREADLVKYNFCSLKY